MKLYRIRNWAELFETAETRKLKQLWWVPVRNKHDGKGYNKLMAMKNGWQHYLAWTLIVQVASKCNPRGTLEDEDGPLSANDLYFKTKVPEAVFEKAFKPLCEIKWLEVVTAKSPGVPADSSGEQGHPLEVQVRPEGKGRVGKGREGTRPTEEKEQKPALSAVSFSDRVQVGKSGVVFAKCLDKVGWATKKAAYLSQIVNGDAKYQTIVGKKIILAMILQLPDRRARLKERIQSEPRFVGDWFMKWARKAPAGYEPRQKRQVEADKLWKEQGG